MKTNYEKLTIDEILKKEGLKEKEKIKYPIKKYDKKNNEIYFENSNGFWEKNKIKPVKILSIN